MIINGTRLLQAAPIKNMLGTKETNGIVSHGLTESGYDIRIKQTVQYYPEGSVGYLPVFDTEEVLVEDSINRIGFTRKVMESPTIVVFTPGTKDCLIHSNTRFVLASAIEEFDMPDHLMGQVLNKSTWARTGVDSSMTTNIEPGWKGFLTLELVFHGNSPVTIPAGSGIAQVIFHELSEKRSYDGKYSNQPDKPVEAISQ